MVKRKKPIGSLSELVAETINTGEAVTLTSEENELVQADNARAIEPEIRKIREKRMQDLADMQNLSIDN